MENAICTFPSGRGVGGTTLINGNLYTRGNIRDFDIWEKLGNPGWSHQDVLPYFKKSEHFHRIHDNYPVYWPYHGFRGELYTGYSVTETFIGKTFLAACKELGYKFTDLNGPWELGYSFPPLNTKHGRRLDGGTAFIIPILSRKNLKVQTDSYVTKINVDVHSKTAKGVTFCHQGTAYFAKAHKEVIISAGGLKSPHLLLLSGIGPKNELNKYNITLVQDLEVGAHMRDHTKYFGLIFSTNHTEESKDQTEYIKEYLHGVGPLSLGGGGSGGFLFAQSDMEKIPEYPDIEIIAVPPPTNNNKENGLQTQKFLQFTNETWYALFGDKDATKHFLILVTNLHTESTGWVKLKSADPFEYPLIDASILSDPEDRDIESLFQGIQLVLKMVEKTKSFQAINAKLNVTSLPACINYKYPSKDWWYCAMRQLTSNDYHQFSSCPMGPDPLNGDVVNYQLKVHGVKRLRVADASVIPKVITGHPNAACMMIGEKVSDMIKYEHGDI